MKEMGNKELKEAWRMIYLKHSAVVKKEESEAKQKFKRGDWIRYPYFTPPGVMQHFWCLGIVVGIEEQGLAGVQTLHGGLIKYYWATQL